MLRTLSFATLALLVASPALAQFTGPSGGAITVAQVADARLGSTVTVVGNIVERQREDYYLFRDDSGDIRVEIERPVWRRQEVGPETLVQLTGEVERGITGRYIDVDTLTILE